jgi:hypothetical protein
MMLRKPLAKSPTFAGSGKANAGFEPKPIEI